MVLSDRIFSQHEKPQRQFGRKFKLFNQKYCQGQLQPTGEPNREMTNQNPKWQQRKAILRDINNRRKALLNSSWENNTTENSEYHSLPQKIPQVIYL